MDAMKSLQPWTRRHRWNLATGLGLVLGLWVAPYVFWRQEAFVFASPGGGVQFRWVALPPMMPDWAVEVYEPLAVVDGWITGDWISLSHRDRFHIGSTANF